MKHFRKSFCLSFNLFESDGDCESEVDGTRFIRDMIVLDCKSLCNFRLFLGLTSSLFLNNETFFHETSLLQIRTSGFTQIFIH
jgi:hypothetical protein